MTNPWVGKIAWILAWLCKNCGFFKLLAYFWVYCHFLCITPYKIYSRISDQICCTRIKVSVSNIPANHQSIQNGIYDQINGTKYYASINKPQAIWYVEEYNNWAIGPLSKLGTKIRSITSTRYIHFIGEFPTFMYQCTIQCYTNYVKMNKI